MSRQACKQPPWTPRSRCSPDAITHRHVPPTQAPRLSPNFTPDLTQCILQRARSPAHRSRKADKVFGSVTSVRASVRSAKKIFFRKVWLLRLRTDHRARGQPAATSYCTGPTRRHAAHHPPDSSDPPAHRADHPSRPASARRIFAQTGSAGGPCAPRAFCCRYKTKRARSARSTLSCYLSPSKNPSRPTSASTHQSRC